MKLGATWQVLIGLVLFIGCQTATAPVTPSSPTGLESDVRRQLSATFVTSPSIEVTVLNGIVYLENVPLGMERRATAAAKSVRGVSRVVLGPPPSESHLLPYLDWPPPLASAMYAVPRSLLSRGRKPPRLREIKDVLRSALTEAGYAESTLFSAPDGFAFVTRMEQTDVNGHPKEGNDRWAGPPKLPTKLSIGEYFKTLLLGPQGQWRMMVVITTPHPVTMNFGPLPPPDYERWFSRGASSLPQEIEELPFTTAHSVTVLIYELSRSSDNSQWEVVVPGRIGAQEHMVRSKILPTLERLHASK